MTPREHVPYMEQGDSNSAPPGAGSAPALSRGLQLLEILDSNPQGLNLTQLSDAIESPKNSTSRLVQTLIDHEYVVRDDNTLIIRLTGKLLRMGQPRLREVSLVECSIDRCVASGPVGETVQWDSECDEGSSREVMSTRAVPYRVDLGCALACTIMPLVKFCWVATCKGTGAHHCAHQVGAARPYDHGQTEAAEECDRVVEQGYSTDWGEADEGIHCVAAPVRDRSNVLVAAIWVSGIAGRMPKTLFPSVAVHVMKAAQEIERKLRS